MAEEFSPEEKLLRLIRGEKKHKDKPAPEKAEPSKSVAEAPSAELKEIKYEPRTTQVLTGEWRYLKFINSALILILILTIGFFVFDFIRPKLERPTAEAGRQPQIATSELQPQISEPQAPSQGAQTPPFSTYAESIGKRELFKPQQVEVKTEKPSEEKAELAYDKLKDLSLIGIIAGEKPQAVVEDKKNQKTYFLYKGQTVNQLKVEEILEDRIILDFDGEKLELSL